MNGKVLDIVQGSDELAVELRGRGLSTRRGDKAIMVRLDEARHLVDALVNGAASAAGATVDGTVIPTEALGPDWERPDNMDASGGDNA